MKKCPKCGHPCFTNICTVCGTPIPDNKRTFKPAIPRGGGRCPKCGHVCTTKTCPVCGSSVVLTDKRTGLPISKPVEISKYLTVDKGLREFTLNGNKYKFENLLEFELFEDGGIVQKGGVGRAIVGGMAFGEVGAIVGATTAKLKNICTSMYIHVTFKNAPVDSDNLSFISYQCDKSSSAYYSAKDAALKCLSALQQIADSIKSEERETAKPVVQSKKQTTIIHDAGFSAADEIVKFKKLADAGIITQEEFEAKKKKLLDL